jgi:transcriptional regulator with XRE-family HTH domain
MPLSQKIQTLRKERNLTQEALADQLNVSRQALSKWELGVSTPEADKIVQLSEFFNVSTDYLLKETIKENTKTQSTFINPSFSVILPISIELIGLIVLINLFDYYYLGYIIQILGVVLFEFLSSINHLSNQFSKVSLLKSKYIFTIISVWLISLGPIFELINRFDKFIFYFIRINLSLYRMFFIYGVYFVFCSITTFILIKFYKKASL